MEEIVSFFVQYKKVFVIAHVFSVIFGMGAALVSDVLFNTFIKDKKINITENKVLSTLSQIVWISLIFIVLSGVGLFFSAPEIYATSSKFLTKVTVILVIVLNGALFHFIVHPALPKMTFTSDNPDNKYVRVRRWSFAFGAVSIISWLLAFILGSVSAIPVAYKEAMILYAAILFVGIGTSQILERKVTRR